MQKQPNVDIHEMEYLVCHVNLLWRRLVNTKIKHLGISGTEKRVLFCIARHPGTTQVQIAKLLELEPQNLVRILDKLSREVWIEKQASPHDRRANCLFVTKKAAQLIGTIKQIGTRAKSDILAEVSEHAAITLMTALTQVRSNLLGQLDEMEEN